MMNRTGKGFTLIEVMVALVILALALPAIFKALGTEISNATLMREKTLAHWVALNKIAELRANQNRTIGNTKGTEEMGNHEWHWQIFISDTPNEEDQIVRVDVEVRVDAKSERPTTSLTTYLGQDSR